MYKLWLKRLTLDYIKLYMKFDSEHSASEKLITRAVRRRELSSGWRSQILLYYYFFVCRDWSRDYG